jgi:hypothetical protein
MTDPFLSAHSLLALVQQVQTDQIPGCVCGMAACVGWESVAESRWPKTLMRQVGSLRDPETAHGVDLTFEEYHPQGTRYDSPNAPVATNFFPYNRCDVFACGSCRRTLLKYTEYGGYYVDPRVRVVQAECIVTSD